MGFLSEIISDCSNSYSTVESTFSRQNPQRASHKGLQDGSQINESVQDWMISSKTPNASESSVNAGLTRNTDTSFLSAHFQSDIHKPDNRKNIKNNTNFSDVVESDTGVDEPFDLGAELHRVQVERLHMQSRARLNVPCSEESQVINREGGDSKEHLHDDNVNRSSIDQKQRSDAEKV
ncbi:MAG: hypothetical protein D6B28_06015, partial [Gammaproteobacteria bacterium]